MHIVAGRTNSGGLGTCVSHHPPSPVKPSNLPSKTPSVELPRRAPLLWYAASPNYHELLYILHLKLHLTTTRKGSELSPEAAGIASRGCSVGAAAPSTTPLLTERLNLLLQFICWPILFVGLV